MKRLCLALVLALTMSVTALPAHAAGQTFHFTFAGKGATAAWTTCPSQPPANVVCTDSFVQVAEQLTKEDGTSFPSTTLFLNQFSYMFDRKGNFIFMSARSGFADATLSIDHNLTNASASATVPLTICTVDRKGNLTCADGGTATVSETWTGQGDLMRVNDNSHTGSKGSTFNLHFRGTFRAAAASGQVSGGDVGTQLSANMFDVTEGSVSVCHGSC